MVCKSLEEMSDMFLLSEVKTQVWFNVITGHEVA